MALLEVKNLTVGIKKEKNILYAVKNISFTIEEGEIVGLAGESGCGKSMTAMSIANLLPQGFEILDGEIIFNHQSLTSMSEKELCRIRGSEIGMIFQEVRQSLNPLIKVGKQITEMLELSMRNGREGLESGLYMQENEQTIKKLVFDLLESLGFDKPQRIFDAFPHQLSRGMCQRVMTAIAAISRPRLLLADEPSSALDENSQERILSLLLEMNRKYNTTILIISHDLSIIRQFCNRFLVMYAGKLIEESAVLDQPYSPLHPYTNALITALPGKSKRGKPLESISGKVPSIEDCFNGCPFVPRCPKAQDICNEEFPPEFFQQEGAKRKVFCYFPEEVLP